MENNTFANNIENIPLMQVNAGPKSDNWVDRLKEEYMALIKYIEKNKEDDCDWFKVESNADGTKWNGKCWIMYDMVKYEFKLEFEIPVSYPLSPIEICLPELDGKTEKMYRGGKICQDIHFSPIWQKNTPKYGIAHALAIALGPWLAVEIPDMIQKNRINKLE